MYTHEDIWAAIDRLANTSGYSTSGLAIKAGLDPTSFNKSKRIQPNGKARWPSMESISKILAVTNTTMSEFVELMDQESGDQYVSKQSIPLLGFAQAGRDGYFSEDGAPIIEKWGDISVDELSNGDYFALEVNGDSMLPLYRDGDHIIVSQNTSLNKGDRIVCKLTNGEVMVKEIDHVQQDQLRLKSLNADYKDLDINKTDILWHGRVVWVSQ